MSSINATIDIGDDSAGVIAGLLSRFPKGRRVRVALTDESSPPMASQPDLVDWLLACPEKDWFTPMERDYGLTVATRNVDDFLRCGVPVINPYE